MKRPPLVIVALACVTFISLVQFVAAANTPALATAHGMIEKVEKESLTLKIRGADGKFAKPLVLKITGTSRIATLSTQNRAGEIVLTQKDTEVKTLEPKQIIAVIYAGEGDEAILLSAVVDRPAGK
jgi:hypothetical protein